METVEWVGNQAAPLERVSAAAALAEPAEAAADNARGARDLAACWAHLDDGVPAVTMYRDVLGVSRSLFVRIIQRAPADRPPVKRAKAVAKAKAVKVREFEEVAEAAREIRDTTALLLMNEGNVPNAEVSRRTGLTTARIAQLRTGTR
jgi:hypothetical protein